jgi:formylglycine-generating enzyme required for sulfatase activity
VGQKRPNDLGLFDMLGNVNVWCHDSAGVSPPRRVAAWIDDEDSNEIRDDSSRVIRGGSFDRDPSFLRSSTRIGGLPGIRTGTLGLRVARTVPGQPN